MKPTDESFSTEANLAEIASSEDSVFNAILAGTLESATDLVQRVADTGVDRMEREVEFAGQTWTVTVVLKQ